MREEHRAGLVVGQGVQPIDELTCQAQLVGVGPLGGELLDLGPVLPEASRHMTSCETVAGALSAASRLRAFWTRSSPLIWEMSPSRSFSPWAGKLDSGLAVGVGLGEADQPGGQVAGLSGLELGERQAGGRH